MSLYLSYQKFAQPMHISSDIYHLLAKTFTGIIFFRTTVMVYSD